MRTILKKYKGYLQLVFLLVTVFSCQNIEDFLDKKPLTQVTEASFWNSVDNLKLYTNQFYPMFPGYSNVEKSSVWEDCNSDNLQWKGIGDINIWIVGNNTENVSTDEYNYDYVRSLNIAISNFDKYEGKKEANQYMGEIYFFRAYDYFNKLRIFGGVPYVDKRITDVDKDIIYSARMSRYDLTKKILEDIDRAISLLNDRASVEQGRVNKEAALAFKSRVALFEGTWEKYHSGGVFGVSGKDGTEFLEIVVKASKDLIDKGTASIYSTNKPKEDYHNMFIKTDLSAVSEAILWRKYDKQKLGVGHSLQYYTGSGAGMGMTKDLVESYLCTDGKDIEVSTLYKGDNSIKELTENRDLRLLQTVAIPGKTKLVLTSEGMKFYETNFLGDPTASKRSTTGYVLSKYRDTIPDYSISEFSITPVIIFRYAEVLLNYAEAKAELGTLTQSDLDISINKIRDRVGMPHMNLTPISNSQREFPQVNGLINEIRRERRVELAAEGYRFDDLRRWAVAEHKLTEKRPRGVKFNPSESERGTEAIIKSKLDNDGYVDFYKDILPGGYGFKADRDYLKPIPLSQIQMNDKLKQNPGWSTE